MLSTGVTGVDFSGSSLCTYCSHQIHCVTTGGGNLKLIFGKGTKLSIESSEYQECIYSIDENKSVFLFDIHAEVLFGISRTHTH